MKPENKAYLEEHRPIWDSLRMSECLRFPSLSIPGELARIMREEFRPGYTYDAWCNHCVATMVREVYKEFEKWEAEQAQAGVAWEDREPYSVHFEIKEDAENTTANTTPYSSESDTEAELVMEEPATIIEPTEAEKVAMDQKAEEIEKSMEQRPITPVKANFPKHNKNHRR